MKKQKEFKFPAASKVIAKMYLEEQRKKQADEKIKTKKPKNST